MVLVIAHRPFAVNVSSLEISRANIQVVLGRSQGWFAVTARTHVGNSESLSRDAQNLPAPGYLLECRCLWRSSNLNHFCMLLGRVPTGWRILRRNQYISRLRQWGSRCRLFFACIWVQDRWGGWQARRRAQLQCPSLRSGGWGRLGIREGGDSEREGFPVTTFFD